MPLAGAPTEVDAYLAALPLPQRAALEKLRRTIRAAAPDAIERMSYGMPSFRQVKNLVWYAAFRDHLSFFAGNVDALPPDVREDIAPYVTSKGTMRFTSENPLPPSLVRRVVKARVKTEAGRARRAEKTPARGAKRTGKAKRAGGATRTLGGRVHGKVGRPS